MSPCQRASESRRTRRTQLGRLEGWIVSRKESDEGGSGADKSSKNAAANSRTEKPWEVALAYLGLDHTATLPTLRRAWQNKARTLHPDVNHSPFAQEEFIKAWEAYETVLDHLTALAERRQASAAKTGKKGAPRAKQHPAPYYCRDCGDGFSHLGDCFRCGVPVLSRTLEAEPTKRPDVERLIKRLDNARPSLFSRVSEHHWLLFFTLSLYVLGYLHWRTNNFSAAALVLGFALLGTVATRACFVAAMTRHALSSLNVPPSEFVADDSATTEATAAKPAK